MMSDKPQSQEQLHTDQLVATRTAPQQPVPRKPADSPSSEPTRLFAGSEAERFRDRWVTIQAGFVDEPRRSVEQADTLVAEVTQRIAQVFADERSQLEKQWDVEGDIDTEQLRVALRRYRLFFDRLLSM